MCLLPKGGAQATTTNPLDARPVVLLPLLYRMWAWKRGKEIASWLTANSMDGLPVASRSAEDYGTFLAAELEKALVLDEPVLAVCVDQSKAYDSVRLDLLAFLLAGSGMPPGSVAAHAGHGQGPPAAQGHVSSRGVERTHLRDDPRLPSGHTDHVVPAGEVAAWSHHRGPGSHCPVLGRRQHGGRPRRGSRPRGLG